MQEPNTKINLEFSILSTDNSIIIRAALSMTILIILVWKIFIRMLSKRIFIYLKSGKWSNQGNESFHILEILNHCLLTKMV